MDASSKSLPFAYMMEKLNSKELASEIHILETKGMVPSKYKRPLIDHVKAATVLWDKLLDGFFDDEKNQLEWDRLTEEATVGLIIGLGICERGKTENFLKSPLRSKFAIEYSLYHILGDEKLPRKKGALTATLKEWGRKLTFAPLRGNNVPGPGVVASPKTIKERFVMLASSFRACKSFDEIFKHRDICVDAFSTKKYLGSV